MSQKPKMIAGYPAGQWIAAGVIGAALGIFILVYNGEERSAARQQEKAAEYAKKTCESANEAFWISQEFVGRLLKAPATAEFPATLRDQGLRSEYAGECTHEVWAYVDSQNGFGAMIRTDYYAKVQYQKHKDNWTLLDIRM